MAVIHLYDGINKKTTYTFNGRLSEHIHGVDWAKSIILRGGYRIPADYEVQPNDVIFIRKTPGAATTVAIAVVATALVAGGVAVGVSMYNQKKQLAEMEKASKAAKAAGDQSEKLPYVRGTRNQPATGRTFPYAIGKSLMSPYRLCPPHITIAGTDGVDQYYNAVLEVAFNNILIEKIKMGETVIKDFTGTTTPQNGQYTWDSGVYYDQRNLIEIRQTGAFTDNAFNKKIIFTELNEEIPHRHAVDDPDENAQIEAEWQAGVVQELPNNAKSVEVIALFDGLQKYDDGWQNQTITLQPQWTNANNPTENDWHNFTNGFNQNGTYSNTFTRNTKKQMRFIATQDFTAAQAYEKTIKIRVRRTTPKADGSAKDTVYLMGLNTTIYDAEKSSVSSLVTAEVMESDKRDKCCRIGVRIVANANTQGLTDAISVIESGCARTWVNGAWTSAKTPTSNLAAWVLELLTTSHHAPSQYTDAELDLDTFGALYEYCDTMGFKADGVITNGAPKKNTIDALLKNANAALVYNKITGLIEVAIDNGRDYSVALLNSENILSISTTKEFKRKTDGKKVKYINAAADYDVDTVIFMRDGGSYDPASDTLTETALQYVTSYEHAFKIAWRQMAEELAQPRVITIRAGLESAYYPLYSRVDVQHKTLKNGITHGVIKGLTWQNSYLKKIILDGFVTFPANTACGVIINCVSDNGHGTIALKVSGSGRTNELEVTTTLRNNAPLIPSAGNVLSFGALDNDGEFTTVTSQMKITNAEESGGEYTLTLVDYNPAIYEYGELPTYKSNITTPPNGRAQTIEQQREYITQGDAEASASGAAQAAVDTVTTGHRFTNVYKLRAPNECLEEIIAKMDDDARNASASISISEDEILLQVDNVEKGLRGLIDIQAGAVTALVEGGGASGQMSLTLNLPAMIDASTRAAMITASTEEKVNAVYALVAGTTYYAIKGNASNQAVKALWDDAIAGGLIASQIILSADQINIAGKTIYTSSKTDSVATTSAESKRNDVAQKLGYADWSAMETAATQNKTIIDGGLIRTSLIDTDAIKATQGFFTNIEVSGEFIGRVDGKLSRTEVTATSVSDLRTKIYNAINEQWYVNKAIDADGFIDVQTKYKRAIIQIYAIQNNGYGMFHFYGRPIFVTNEGDPNLHTYLLPGFIDPGINYDPSLQTPDILNTKLFNLRTEIWLQESSDDSSSNYWNDYPIMTRSDMTSWIQDCIKINKALIYF